MPLKNPPEIDCPRCYGTGSIPMPLELQAVLRTVKRLKRASAATVAKALRWNGEASAINNRLEALRDLEKLSREREGKTYFYTIVKP